MRDGAASKAFWNRAAQENAAWYIATGFDRESAEFFESGKREVDTYLRFAEVELGKDDLVVEIGCGVGRMTRRLAERAGQVVATDVSGDMIAKARANLADSPHVSFVEIGGDGELPGEAGSATAVFSYITMQHVPTASAQERYFAEAIRLIAPGGWVLIQFRRPGVVARILDWTGHFVHRVRGRKTFDPAWRGARVRPSALTAHASRDVSVEILPLGRRHIWARALRRANDAGAAV